MIFDRGGIYIDFMSIHVSDASLYHFWLMKYCYNVIYTQDF